MSGEAPANLLVMLSGAGRTLEYLCDAIERGELHAHIPIVVASRECPGAEKARRRGIETLVREGGIDATELDGIVASRAIDWVVLAGYRRLLPITARVRGRVVNIHPALLPRFGGAGMHGMRVHEEVARSAAAGAISETGCTVHLADDGYDTGPIIEQRRCPVRSGETPETIAARVFELEKACYPSALGKLIRADATRT